MSLFYFWDLHDCKFKQTMSDVQNLFFFMQFFSNILVLKYFLAEGERINLGGTF